jgi:signal transduction histidine kinase
LPLRDRDGSVIGVIGTYEDITERKRLETDLRHAQKLEAVGQLAAGIAHEINTPIQFVGDNTRFFQDAFRDIQKLLGSYEGLRRSAVGKVDMGTLEASIQAERQADWEYLKTEVPKALEQTLDGVDRVARIVRAMKEFSHVDRSKDKAAADLNRALESTLVVARNELKYVADVETDFGQIPPVVCNLGDLNQVFLNLLINAAHAIADVVKGTGNKGKIRVRTWQEREQVVVAISDTGGGIPEEIRGKIFEPFFTTKEVGKGTGQGLTLARNVVVERHGGTLTFETEVGKGSTFFVRLPISGSPGAREDEERTIAAEKVAV